MEFELKYVRPIDLSLFERAIYRRSSQPAFVVGKNFDLEFSLKNRGTEMFPGGVIEITAEFESERPNTWKIELPIIDIQKQYDSEALQFSIPDPSYCMIMVVLTPYSDVDEKDKPYEERIFKLPACDIWMKKNNLGTVAHVESIYAQTEEEFYQYWAMIIAMYALVYLVLETKIGYFIDWVTLFLIFFQFLSTILLDKIKGGI